MRTFIVTYRVLGTNKIIDHKVDVYDEMDIYLGLENKPKYLNGFSYEILSVLNQEDFERLILSTIEQKENGINNQYSKDNFREINPK